MNEMIDSKKCSLAETIPTELRLEYAGVLFGTRIFANRHESGKKFWKNRAD